MIDSSRKAFARRLSDALRAEGYVSKRGAKSGVDVSPITAWAGVTREMARRYVSGQALPDPDRMAKIADALHRRVAWLRDGEGPENPDAAPRVAESPRAFYGAPAGALADEAALEIARVWSTLTPARQQWFRQMLFVEAAVSRIMPWLNMMPPTGERYEQFENRAREDFARIAKQLQLDL